MVYSDKKLSIVADENIPYVQEVFSSLGEVKLLSAREISKEKLMHSDVLLVRSVTAVGRELLSGTPVKFVGTATIGTDHIDIAFLQKSNIFFSNAAGSNANSVAEYFITSLLEVSHRRKFVLEGKSLGIVGVGNIGKLVAQKAIALGLRPLLNDPPRARQEGAGAFRTLTEVIKSDIITCHTPLIKQGADTTVHLLASEQLALMSDKVILMNTGRGPVIDNEQLRHWKKKHADSALILDVWENEPEPDCGLLTLADIATPHIAGYSFDGKVNGTEMIYKSLCDCLNIAEQVSVSELKPRVANSVLEVNLGDYASKQDLLAYLTGSVYDIVGDDRRMRGILTKPAGERGGYFDKLRKEYPIRREFNNYTVKLAGSDSHINKEDLTAALSLLGFVVC
ncbi:MAG: 4-phosphoerythronate dehydrogenase [Sedimentisphaerales bacterium]|nr:4-phosphoerythronate dehydrogenase [Sedimentisphaerales bacterium]